MMSASCGTEIASMRAAVGEKIVGRQLECGRTAFQLYIYDMMVPWILGDQIKLLQARADLRTLLELPEEGYKILQLCR